MCKAHFISCFANSCNLIKFLKQYLNIFVRNFVLCIQIRFVSTEKNYAHRLACILFYEYSLYIQNIVIIKATRLQAWAPAGGGARVGRRPPPPSKIRKKFLAILGAFLLRFSHFGGPFHHVGAFCYFLLYGGFFGGACRPPTHNKMSVGAHDCKEGLRAFSPDIFCVTAI